MIVRLYNFSKGISTFRDRLAKAGTHLRTLTVYFPASEPFRRLFSTAWQLPSNSLLLRRSGPVDSVHPLRETRSSQKEGFGGCGKKKLQ
jgi:hypothetical protein